MGKNKKSKQKTFENIPQVPQTTSLEPKLAFNEISKLLLDQINSLDNKINSFILVNFLIQLLVIIISVILIVIGIFFTYQHGSIQLKLIFSSVGVVTGLLFLKTSIRINLIQKLIMISKRNSQIKVILIGFLKQVTYLERTPKKDNDEISQLIAYSKEVVQQTVDDLENPFD